MYNIDGIDSQLVKSVCSKLKAKWMKGEEQVNISAMCDYYKIDELTARKIISWYESQLLCTKFKIS